MASRAEIHRRRLFELAGTYRPEPTTDLRPMRGTLGITSGRTRQKAYVCPRKIWGNHPDPEVRRIAGEQSREMHEAHGPCRGECRTTLGMFAKNDTTLRIALGEARARRWKEQNR